MFGWTENYKLQREKSRIEKEILKLRENHRKLDSLEVLDETQSEIKQASMSILENNYRTLVKLYEPHQELGKYLNCSNTMGVDINLKSNNLMFINYNLETINYYALGFSEIIDFLKVIDKFSTYKSRAIYEKLNRKATILINNKIQEIVPEKYQKNIRKFLIYNHNNVHKRIELAGITLTFFRFCNLRSYFEFDPLNNKTIISLNNKHYLYTSGFYNFIKVKHFDNIHIV